MFTETHIIDAFFVLGALIVMAAGVYGYRLVRQDSYDDPYDPDNDEYPEDDDDYDEDDSDYPEDGRGYDDEDEITMSRMDWIGKLEYRRMLMRAERPHLYSDRWFEDCRASFSLWTVEQAEIAADDYAEQMEAIANAA
jgi:hypothetical protein